MRKIYLDVDDTLADFRKRAADMGIPDSGQGFYTNDPSTWTEEQKDIDRRVREIMEGDDFWPYLPVVDGAFELIAAAREKGDTYLLTALPRGVSPEVAAKIRRQKLLYCHDVLNFPLSRIIVCERHEKAKYATHQEPEPNGDGVDTIRNVLIDDAAKNVAEWEAARGIGHHHFSMMNSIEFVRSL